MENISKRLIAGKQNEALAEALVESINVKIKAEITEISKDKFIKDVCNIPYLSKDVNYIVVNVFLQLGSQLAQHPNVFEYKNKNDMTLSIQPKIKNYVTFKTKESAKRYMEEELSSDTLYLILDVIDGKVKI